MSNFSKKNIVLNEIESTNNYANQLILSNAADDGTVVLAQYQTKGRGNAGNQWESEYGKNLLMSMVLFPRFLDAAKQFMISKAVSLAMVDFLKQETNFVTIKWPNDIYVEDRKIAGILIENSVMGHKLFSTVIGIGLNLNQEFFFSDAPNPVSLTQLTGKEYNINAVAERLVNLILEWYKKLETNNFTEINENYFSNLYRNEGWWKFSKQGEIFEARIIAIGEFGHLILEDLNGKVHQFGFKEVEFIIGNS
ncbi:MAG: biotin--[acetyl-CoA-carboxylase] ligase [Draconibacterium sp.]